jgi:hypothetical protein
VANDIVAEAGGNQPSVLGTPIYEAVRVRKEGGGEDWFEPVLNVRTYSPLPHHQANFFVPLQLSGH